MRVPLVPVGPGRRRPVDGAASALIYIAAGVRLRPEAAALLSCPSSPPAGPCPPDLPTVSWAPLPAANVPVGPGRRRPVDGAASALICARAAVRMGTGCRIAAWLSGRRSGSRLVEGIPERLCEKGFFGRAWGGGGWLASARCGRWLCEAEAKGRRRRPPGGSVAAAAEDDSALEWWLDG